jgi:hypothetical protein
MRLHLFSRVISSTASANWRCFLFGNFSASSRSISHLLSGLNFDFTLCQIPGILSPAFFIELTKSVAVILSSTALPKYVAAPSIAQPNFGQIVVKPAIRDDLRSFHALAVIIALVAPETAGPWSASNINIALMNSNPYSGKSLFNQRFQITFAKLPA